jgi:hypothetical protein
MGLLIAMTDPYTLLFWGWAAGFVTCGALVAPALLKGGRRGR